jgi:PAS domain S-box-containing protein
MATNLLTLDRAIQVLVLEDDQEDFLLLSRMMAHFTDLKTEVVRVTEYTDGLGMLRESFFDAVLVGHRWGGKDGLKFIGDARAEGYRCPMILLTHQGRPEVDLEALRQGASEYLIKASLNAPLLERTLRYALERQRTLEALRRSDEYYRAIIENSQDLITIIDERGLIRFDSHSVTRILGFQVEERLGQDFFLYLHPQDLEEARQRLQRAVREQVGEGEGEYRMRHKDGSWRYMEFKAKNLLQLSGLQGVLFNTRDVTERKRSLDALRKVERLAFIGQMAAGLAHEIRNPLAIIQMSAEMLRDDDESGAEGRRHASVIVEQCGRLLKLMNETMNYSRSKPIQLSLENPRELMEYALKLARIQFGSAHEKFDVIWLESPSGPSLKVDRQKAELVLVNLILNAFQALPLEGGRLGLGWLVADDGIVLIVEDNGPGMSEQDLDHIFDPFFTTKQHGSGLGLWLCQRMVDASGGRLSVESGLNKGSRFTVWLPVHGVANEDFDH